MKIYISVLLVLSSFLLHSQTTITADVLDEKANPIVAANALILDPVDSTLINGELILEGELKVTCERPSALLKIQALGYTDYWQIIECKGEAIDLGAITLEKSSVALEQVNVVASALPKFSMEGGVLKVNVENSALSSSGSVIDVLRSTPGILVTRDDQVELFGKGAARIFIDGQEIDDPNIIQSINSDDVKEVEVMRNPSAKYDASGKGGVINIITKSASLQGTLYTVRGNITKAKYLRGYLNGTMSYKKEKFNLFLSLDYNPYKAWEEEDYTRNLEVGSEAFALNNDVEVDYHSPFNSNFNTKLGYKLNERNQFNLGYRGRVQFRVNDRTNENNITKDGEIFSQVKSTNVEDDEYIYHIINAEHIFSDTVGNVIRTSISNTNYTFEDVDDITEEIEGGGSFKRRGTGNNDIGILIGKLDVENPLFNKWMKLETGLKYSLTKNESENLFFNRVNDDWVRDLDLQNSLDYNESNYAAYVNAIKNVDKWTFRLGARYEGTEAEATSFRSGNYLDTTYHLLFKSANVEYKWTDDIVTNLSYSERIQRPNFQDVDPYIEYLDSFSILKGNANLRPEIIRSLEFTGSYSGYPLLTLGYSYTDDPITLVVEKEQENPLVNVGINRNLKYSRSFESQIILPYQNDWWTSANGFGWTRNTVSYKEFNGGDDFVKDQYFVFSNQDFSLKSGWNFGALFVWYSPGVDGVFEFESGSFTNLWIGKKLMDGKLNLRLMANDIFRKNIERASTQIADLRIRFRGYSDSRRVRFQISYKFGKLESGVKNNNQNSDEFDRIKL